MALHIYYQNMHDRLVYTLHWTLQICHFSLVHFSLESYLAHS